MASIDADRSLNHMDPTVTSPARINTLSRDGIITIVLLMLVFAAFDDITTDNATSFVVEYSMLVVCAGWLVLVIARLFRIGRYRLGTVSALALLVGMSAGRAVASRTEWTAYIVFLVAYVWFWALSVTLLWLGRRQNRIVHGASA